MRSVPATLLKPNARGSAPRCRAFGCLRAAHTGHCMCLAHRTSEGRAPARRRARQKAAGSEWPKPRRACRSARFSCGVGSASEEPGASGSSASW
eukprot:1689015-Alexandrium_andersonii.AAC.1